MGRKELIRNVKTATMEALTREYSGNLFCEINQIRYEYWEDNYDDERSVVELRYGRWEKDGKNNFEYTVELYDLDGKSYDYILGVIDTIIMVKEGMYQER